MYQQNNKKAAVTEIQSYLFFLSDKKYPQIPRVPIDGVFDKETENAVIEFQKIMLLSPTGVVDFETFTKLYNEYESAMIDYNTENYIFGNSNLPLKENDQNEDVRALHVMVNRLRKTYPQINAVGTGSYFSTSTKNALKELRGIFYLPGLPILDKALYRRMKEEINARERIEKNKKRLF
ncbi:MAG: peptidoglycan-binding protein [Clostridia bacterium]|nr:peptidoglycan-binding protein [Clostridia bacterium]